MKEYQLAGRHEGVRALKDIALVSGSEFYPIRKGEFVMLRGPSGGGKTTLLNVLGAIDHPSSGSIEILGHSIDDKSADDFLSHLRLSKIGL